MYISLLILINLCGKIMLQMLMIKLNLHWTQSIPLILSSRAERREQKATEEWMWVGWERKDERKTTAIKASTPFRKLRVIGLQIRPCILHEDHLWVSSSCHSRHPRKKPCVSPDLILFDNHHTYTHTHTASLKKIYHLLLYWRISLKKVSAFQ